MCKDLYGVSENPDTRVYYEYESARPRRAACMARSWVANAGGRCLPPLPGSLRSLKIAAKVDSSSFKRYRRSICLRVLEVRPAAAILESTAARHFKS